jgi:hypothetical protein
MDIFGICAIVVVLVMACTSVLISYCSQVRQSKFIGQLSGQLAETNEKLLLFLASKETNPIGTRALLAVSKEPKKNIPSPITSNQPAPKESQEGMTFIVGGTPQ